MKPSNRSSPKRTRVGVIATSESGDLSYYRSLNAYCIATGVEARFAKASAVLQRQLSNGDTIRLVPVANIQQYLPPPPTTINKPKTDMAITFKVPLVKHFDLRMLERHLGFSRAQLMRAAVDILLNAYSDQVHFESTSTNTE